MLYSIIPPVLVVLSLFGIIIFLIKKAPEVARLKGNEDFLPKKTIIKRPNFSDDKEDEIEKREEGLRNKFSVALLKMVERSKQIAIGAKGFFGRLFLKVTEKRKKVNRKRIEKEDDASDAIEKDELYEDPYSSETKSENMTTEEARVFSRKEGKEKKMEKKDLFEKILIERIASNPKDIEAYERLGEYYLEIENWEYAKECFKQVLKLNPRNIGVRSKMRKLERILNK